MLLVGDVDRIPAEQEPEAEPRDPDPACGLRLPCGQANFAKYTAGAAVKAQKSGERASATANAYIYFADALCTLAVEDASSRGDRRYQENKNRPLTARTGSLQTSEFSVQIHATAWVQSSDFSRFFSQQLHRVEIDIAQGVGTAAVRCTSA